VTAVLGPFNLPGHLPHAHILPALLAGNTVVFKPSEQAPAVAHRLAQLWESTRLPPGVFNMIQGTGDTGRTLVEHPDLDGLFFTGGYATGQAICRALAVHPEKIVALEMGGNNPLGVWETADVQTAAYYIVQSAFITAGQRCTCARRLILPAGPEGDRCLEALIALTRRLRIGPFTEDPEPFIGPVISSRAAEKLLAVQDALRSKGGEPLLELKRLGDQPAFLSPGIIDVTRARDRPDEELFGPLLQVIRVPDFNALIHEANTTAFGLAAGLLSDRRERFDEFYRKVKAGIINWNGPTTGAKGTLPFGGVGRSGNHRPSGYFAADYCSYPIASIEHTALELPQHPAPGVFS
jgi:succinylglutamic semialdehyde dehydrogenase